MPSVRSGGIHTRLPVTNSNAAIGLVESWFRKWRIRISTKYTQLHAYRRSENGKIQELGHYEPIGDKHLHPLSLLAR
jgi:hypothetical protein